MRRLTACLIHLFLAAPALADYPARVVGITDGDTLTVLTAEKRQVKIRLYGADAPETGQYFGARAKQACSELAFGKQVTILLRGTDRWKQTVAEVILPDGRNLNQELVGSGMAHWYRAYAPHAADLRRLEGEARAAKRGLWSQKNPVPPWEWRKPQVAGNGQVIGNWNSRLYHAANCRSVARMKEANRAVFRAARDAEAAGYRRARDCR